MNSSFRTGSHLKPFVVKPSLLEPWTRRALATARRGAAVLPAVKAVDAALLARVDRLAAAR